jgi:hypothetical protein
VSSAFYSRRRLFPKIEEKFGALYVGTYRNFKVLGSGHAPIAGYVTTTAERTLQRTKPLEQIVKGSVGEDGGGQDPEFG